MAICGSLRAASSNLALLHAMSILAPQGVEIAVYDGLASIPPFNPDLDIEPATPAVSSFRSELQQSSALVISSPEYAHGVPGALKNALDWVVASNEFSRKPVAIINTSPISMHAHGSLVEIVSTMDARVILEASITLPLRGRSLDASAIASDPAFASPLRSAIQVLMESIAV